LSEAAGINPPMAMPAAGRRISSTIVVEKATLRSRMWHEGPLFVLASVVIALSFLLPTLQSHHAWLNIPCVFHAVTHLPCLACGLTRSFVFAAHGDFYDGFRMHLLGPLLFTGTCAMAVYFGGSLVSGYRIRFNLSDAHRRIAFWSVLGIFLVCWGLKLAFIRSSW
jgi:hypothetical protein